MRTVDVGDASDIGKKAAAFLISLRQHSAAQHTLLESHPLLSAIVSDDVTVRHYHAYLLLMNEVALAYEAQILPLTVKHVRCQGQTSASMLISDDMHKTGFSMPVGLNMNHYTIEAQDLSVPFALGFRYVMEGSRLGGRVIYRHIERNLGFSEHTGARYLADDGVNTGVNWKAFLAFFSAYIAEHDGEDKAISGATFAFSSIYDFFRSNRLLYDF